LSVCVLSMLSGGWVVSFGLSVDSMVPPGQTEIHAIAIATIAIPVNIPILKSLRILQNQNINVFIPITIENSRFCAAI